MKLEYEFVALPKFYRHLTGNELKVFVTMFDQWSQMKNEDGWYFRSQKQLCEDTGLTGRTLRNIIKKFVEKGVIFTTTYNDGVKMATYNKANEYKINMKKVVEMSEKKVVKNTIEGGKKYPPYKNIRTKNKIENKNKDNNSTCNTGTCMEEEIKKDKISDNMNNGTMDISPRDEMDESFLEFYNSLDDGDDWDESQMEEVNKNIKENEMNDNGMNEMNANGNGVKRNESITSTVVNETRPTSTESMKIYTAIVAQTETEKKRESLLQNIESGKKFMYEASKTKDLNQWKAQMDYITIQFNNLKNITPTDAYNGVRKDFKRWWDATKPYFPKGWNEKAQQPQKKKLLTKIKESDQQVLQYWIDSTDDNKDEMISRLLSKWEDVYEPDTIAQIFEKSQINASCASETSDVDNCPIQHVKTQYKPQEEECGDFVNDSLRIYCINNPSVQVAN